MYFVSDGDVFGLLQILPAFFVTPPAKTIDSVTGNEHKRSLSGSDDLSFLIDVHNTFPLAASTDLFEKVGNLCCVHAEHLLAFSKNRIPSAYINLDLLV